MQEILAPLKWEMISRLALLCFFAYFISYFGFMETKFIQFSLPIASILVFYLLKAFPLALHQEIHGKLGKANCVLEKSLNGFIGIQRKPTSLMLHLRSHCLRCLVMVFLDSVIFTLKLYAQKSHKNISKCKRNSIIGKISKVGAFS